MEGNTIIPTIPTACPKMLHSLCPLPVAAVLPPYITKEPVHIFIDCLEAGVWRLEVMPDAVTVSDPFAKPSLAKEVVSIIYGCWDMALQIPD